MATGKYYAIPLHMHSVFEGMASMRGHMTLGKELGMEYIWITDHDFLMGRNINYLDGFSFSEGTLMKTEPWEKTDKKLSNMFGLITPYGITFDKALYDSSYEAFKKNLQNVEGFILREGEEFGSNISVENKRMKINAKSSDNSFCKTKVNFYSAGYRTQHHYRTAMVTGVSITFPFEANLSADSAVVFEIAMSQQLPDCERAYMRYVVGNSDAVEGDTIIKTEPKDGIITLNLSDDAEKYAKGGLDNSFVSFEIAVITKNEETVYIGDVKIERKYEYEEALKRQRALAKKIGEEIGIIPFVTNEISSAGQHKVSFNTSVPVIDYSDGEKDHEFACNWVKSHGGIFSLNHPYFDWERVVIKPKDKAVAIKRLADEYVENKCWGASMLEVGFPEGRCGFSLDQHLALWDQISKKGVFISGYGDSDNHALTTKWFDGNNFCAYLYSENPSEESFIEAMKSGDLFTGDPVHFKGDATFTGEGGIKMGQVYEREENETEKKVSLTANGIGEGCIIDWVIDGVHVAQEPLNCGEEISLRVPLEGDINFVRAQIYNSDGRCIFLTNPIYFALKGKFEIPNERKCN